MPLGGTVFAFGGNMVRDTRFVYVLKSPAAGTHVYVGLTSDVAARISSHNDGRLPTHGTAPSMGPPRRQGVQRPVHGRPLRAIPEIRLGPRLREAPFRTVSWTRPLDQRPVSPRPQDSQRTHPRSGKCCRCQCCRDVG